MHDELANVAMLKGKHSDPIPYPLPYPIHTQPGGLLSWGGAQDGWTFFWLRDGKPEEWDLVVTFKWVEKHFLFRRKSMIRFLVDLIQHPFDESLRLSPSFEIS